MKKISGLAMILLLAAGALQAQNPADEEYIKAMTQNDPCQKVQMLKAYVTKYAGQGTQYENFAYVYLTLTPCASKPAAESIKYGEKAITMSGVDDDSKAQILATIAGLYLNEAGGLDKAKSFGQQLIDFANAAKAKDASTAAKWNQFAGAGMFIQGQAAEKAKDYQGAAASYIAAYKVLKNPSIAATLKKLGKTLYDAKQFDAAETIYREFYAAAKDSESAIILGQTLFKSGKTDEALGIFKETYAKKKSGELAYNIGIILANQAKTNPAVMQEAIAMLLEASFLYPAQAQNARNMAQSLFFTGSKDAKYNELVAKMGEHTEAIAVLTKTFNEKYGDKSEEEMSDGEKRSMQKILDAIEVEKTAIAGLEAQQKTYIDKFNALVAQAKTRLGK